MFSILRLFAGIIMKIMSNKVTNNEISEETLRTAPYPTAPGFCSNFDGHFRIFL